MLSSERLYYSNSFLKQFAAVVSDVREGAGENGELKWKVSLDQTAFYPTSGGQPFDTGALITSSPGELAFETPVEAVEEDDVGVVWHWVRKPLAVGANINGQINWARRFDHMQQHTGQHLLSAVFWHEMNAATVSFHLGETTSTIDLCGRSFAQESLERVEQIANEIIYEDRPVSARDVSREQAEAMLAQGEMRKLPERQGAIRLIEIADCDLNACGGTHVRSTGQIGALLIRGMEKVSRGVRVEFVCGLRAVRAARADAEILREAAGLLSSGTVDLPAVVGRLLKEAKAAAKQREKLREGLAVLQGAALAGEETVNNEVRIVVREWKDLDRDYVKLLASRTAAAAPSTAVLFFARDTDPVRVFLARSPNLQFDCGRILRESLVRLGLRGGGSADLAQGEVPAEHGYVLRDAVINAIRAAVAKAREQV